MTAAVTLKLACNGLTKRAWQRYTHSTCQQGRATERAAMVDGRMCQRANDWTKRGGDSQRGKAETDKGQRERNSCERKARMETNGTAPKGKQKSKRQQQKGTGKAGISPDRQEDCKGLPYLVIQAVVSDGLNIHLIHMAQHIQGIALSHIPQNPHCQPRPC